MSDFLLTQVINYGAPILAAVVFFGALGVPFPATLIVIAAGAFSREGFLPWHTTGLIAWICVVLGDCLSYAMGHYARGPVLRRLGNRAGQKPGLLGARMSYSDPLVTGLPGQPHRRHGAHLSAPS
jgi:membrane protein DedA with SNARE-associated domain